MKYRKWRVTHLLVGMTVGFCIFLMSMAVVVTAVLKESDLTHAVRTGNIAEAESLIASGIDILA